MGMIHEHQNPRGTPIKWNVTKVEEYMKDTQGWDIKQTQENVIDRYSIDTINGSDFDPDSVMLYFYPADLTLDNKGTHENNTLSLTDMIWLSKIYPGGSKDYNTLYKEIYSSSNSKYIIVILVLFIIFLIFILIIFLIFKKFR
jgi:hypothetical protein